jgi:hypothetical protein
MDELIPAFLTVEKAAEALMGAAEAQERLAGDIARKDAAQRAADSADYGPSPRRPTLAEAAPTHEEYAASLARQTQDNIAQHAATVAEHKARADLAVRLAAQAGVPAFAMGVLAAGDAPAAQAIAAQPPSQAGAPAFAAQQAQAQPSIPAFAALAGAVAASVPVQAAQNAAAQPLPQAQAGAFPPAFSSHTSPQWGQGRAPAPDIGDENRARVASMHQGFADNRQAMAVRAAQEEAAERARASREWTDAVDKSAKGFGRAVLGAANALQSRINSVASATGADKASPNTMNTLNARLAVSMGQLGSGTVALMEGTANRIDELNRSGALKFAGNVVGTGVAAAGVYGGIKGGMWAGGAVGSLGGPAGAAIGAGIGGAAGGIASWWGMGLGTDPYGEAAKKTRSLEGLPKFGMGSMESHYDQMQAMSLSYGGDSPEMQLLREQNTHLEKLGLLLTDIREISRANVPVFK